MCVQQMFCFRLKPILFQEDGCYGVEVQLNAEELWEEIGKNGLGCFEEELMFLFDNYFVFHKKEHIFYKIQGKSCFSWYYAGTQFRLNKTLWIFGGGFWIGFKTLITNVLNWIKGARFAIEIACPNYFNDGRK